MAMLKNGYHGTFHQLSHEYLDRYVDEFSHRHNDCLRNSIDQTGKLERCIGGKRLTYEQLIANCVTPIDAGRAWRRERE